MSLKDYQRKRHFKHTPEPEGKRASQNGFSFCVQKHQASHLHYDFRLELDGVLKSWAVPKGPCLDPAVKRLAVHVEDHPVDYGNFEGTIPQGEYGGGTVLLWDRGHWQPDGDPRADYKAGRLKFHLDGEKLHGGWRLVRSGHGRTVKDRRQWLLFKQADDEAQPLSAGDVLEEQPVSVRSGRSLEEIASKKPPKARPKTKTKTKAKRKKSAEKAKLPVRVEVQLATLAAEAPRGDEWLHEIKFDGYRMICRIVDGQVQFLSRNHKDWTRRLLALAAAAVQLPVKQAILDGEVVSVRPDGTTHFQDLQNAFRDRRDESLHYYVFDLLHLDGEDLAARPLRERKQVLEELLKNAPERIRYSAHIDGDGPAFHRQGCRRGLEGIICKRRDRPYRPGRGRDWLKVKCTQTEEFVIGGYTEPSGSRVGLGALLLGYYDPTGQLVYAGRVGTGFDDAGLADLKQQLAGLERKASPFSNFARGRVIHWVAPKLVAQVTFGQWTRDGLLRHAVFQGLREDKPARKVIRQAPQSQPGEITDEAANEAEREVFDGVRFTSPEKILFAGDDATKLDLANYYRSVAEWILPHLADRPLALVRCPEGSSGGCFFQKHPAPGTPGELRRVPVKEKNKTSDYVVVDNVKGLIALAQIGALEIHTWGSRADRLELPDRLTFDLDPAPDVNWADVVQAAKQVRQFLQDLGLESFLKITGGKGLHLVAPIERRLAWPAVKAFCRGVAERIAAADPGRFTATMSKAARKGKIFVDYLRNDRGATAIAPYSTRAKPDAPVAVPLAWSELTARMRSDQFTIRTLTRRLDGLKDDPWRELPKLRQRLTGPLKKLAKL